MQIKEIDENSIKYVTNREVLNLHLRLHQLWSLYKKGNLYDPKILIQKHNIIVDEFRRRGFRHNFINDLDRIDVTEQNSIFLESEPKNPSTIILKNKFYPTGLSEKDIYNYYMTVKDKLINYIGNRTVSFFISVGDQIVVKRLHKGGRIKLNEENYNYFITGRTLSVHINRYYNNPTNYIVIDIDRKRSTLSDSELLRSLKVAKTLVRNEYMNNLENEEVLFTGNGLHYIVYFKKQYDIDELRKNMISVLERQHEYPVSSTSKKRNTIVYDMSSNWKSSMHISKYSLTKEGLRVLPFKTLNVGYYKINNKK